jgi:hypothetical protein
MILSLIYILTVFGPIRVILSPIDVYKYDLLYFIWDKTIKRPIESQMSFHGKNDMYAHHAIGERREAREREGGVVECVVRVPV